MAYTVMSNMSESERDHSLLKTIDKQDVQRLRNLAGRWMEIASSPGMQKTKKSWSNLHDLKPDRPMVLFETFSVDGFVTDDDLS